MISMLEKAARAVQEAGPVGCCTPSDREAVEIARAVLLAVREPDVDAALAGAAHVNEQMRGPVKADYFAAKDSFTAMIDAILSGEGESQPPDGEPG